MAASAGVNVDAGEPATSAAMTLHKAMPWEFGALLTVRDMAAFRSAYGDQVKSTDKLTLLRPTIDTLLTWAKSCLGVGRFGTGWAKSWLGWSPFRSGEVRAEGRRRTVVFYYKLGDAGCWDFCTTRPFLETSASFTMWLDTLESFVRISLLVCIRDTDHAISPVARVRGMLSRDWAATGNECTVFLGERGLNLCRVELLLRKAWRVLLRLPVPAVFTFVLKDEVARDSLVETIGTKATFLHKC